MQKIVDSEVIEMMAIHDNFKKYEHVKSTLVYGPEIKKECKFSIVIPTYKRVETLNDAIQSCLSQRGINDYNIIVVDNNPNRGDATELYITKLSNPKVKYYKNTDNVGMTGNWNRCVELCEGEYAVLLHDDDILFPDYLSNISKIVSKHQEVDILYVGKSIWHQNCGENQPQMLDDNKRYPLYKASIIMCLFTHNHAPTGMTLKKNIFLSSGGFDERCYPSADYWFYSYAVENGLGVYNYAKPLFAYRYLVNESLNQETQLSFVLVTYPLRKWLLEKMNSHLLIRKSLMLVMNNFGLRWCTPETIRNADIDDISYSKILCKKGILRNAFLYTQKLIMVLMKRYIYRRRSAVDLI